MPTRQSREASNLIHKPDNLCGVINIHKEKGYTSHDVVAIVRRLFGRIKTGHTGTLDPAAEGVLPVCIGRATKISDFIMSETKGYRAVVKLGTCTDTEDDTGNVTETREVLCGKPEIENAVSSFLGIYMQTPPMYSAIKQGGKKLYELARKGENVERSPRRAEIYDIKILEYLDDQSFRIDVNCSKGTYIRTLCADIGRKLGCGACMGDLLRYRSGNFLLENSIKLSQLEDAVRDNCAGEFIIPIETILSDCKRVTVSKNFNKALYNGNIVLQDWLIKNASVSPGENVLVFDEAEDLVGIYSGFINNSEINLKPAVILKIGS